VAPYRSDDGQIEIGALAEFAGEDRWAVEIKWRGKRVGVKELQRQLTAAATLGARSWYILKAGLTPEAQTLARQEGMMISSQGEIERLARIVRRA
jgi:hypothetical protein